MERKEKTKYATQRDAESALFRIWESGKLRDKTPVRVYKENGWWYLTSKEKIGSKATDVREVTPEEIADRLEHLTKKTRKNTKTGKVSYSKMPLSIIQAVIADVVTGKYDLKEIAEHHHISHSAVSNIVSDWIKDKKLIKQLMEEE